MKKTTTEYYCDNCGSKVHPQFLQAAIPFFGTKPCDLCTGCAIEAEDFISAFLPKLYPVERHPRSDHEMLYNPAREDLGWK